MFSTDKKWFQSEYETSVEDMVNVIVRELESRKFTVAQGIRILEMAQTRIAESTPIKTNL